MSFKRQIKKIVCSILIILISFILLMESKVYSSGIDDPIILEPTDGQYIELRAVKAFEFSEEDFQITMQLWVHGLETTGFTLRLNYDNSVIQPSSIEDNTVTTDSTKFFKFSNGLEANMDMLSISQDESTMILLAAVKDYEEVENPYIVEKEGIGKVLDGTGTDGVMVGEISFKGNTKLLTDDVIRLKSSTEEQPKTGIKVMANKYDYYEKDSMFKFTLDLISSNAKLKSLSTNLADIPDFDRDIFTYSIQVSAMETEITVFPIPEDPNSTITIDDEVVNVDTGIVVPLKNMSEISSRTRIQILVTAEDGVTTEKYILNVEKQGGFLQGAVITSNTYDIHHATIKIYRSDQYIDWKYTNSTELDDYELVAQTDTYDDGIFQLVLPIGKYDVLIDKLGYLDYIIKGVEITQRNTTSIGNKQIIPGDMNKDRNSKSSRQNNVFSHI